MKCINYQTILHLIKSNEIFPQPSISNIMWLLCEIYKARVKGANDGIYPNRISIHDIFLIFDNGLKNGIMSNVVFKNITFRPNS